MSDKTPALSEAGHYVVASLFKACAETRHRERIATAIGDAVNAEEYAEFTRILVSMADGIIAASGGTEGASVSYTPFALIA